MASTPNNPLDIIARLKAIRPAAPVTSQGPLRPTMIRSSSKPKASALKNLLLPLQILDTPRRAVISGVRELVDVLDSDSNTNASFSDFLNQAKDFDYGTGKAFPMKGWGGRILGLVGDIALDPLTYATLGGTVAAKATMLNKAGKVVKTRDVLGKTVIGREGRAKLSEFATARMRDMNQRGAANFTEDAIRTAGRDMYARGKQALPDTVAKEIGIKGPGIYFFGSRIKLPGSAVIGEALETGISKSRLGLVNNFGVEKLQKKLTPRGTGHFAQFGPDTIRDYRIALANGKLKPDDAFFASTILEADDIKRIRVAEATADFEGLFGSLRDDVVATQNGNVVRQLLDNVDTSLIPAKGSSIGASPEQIDIAVRWRTEMDKIHGTVLGSLKEADPDFALGYVKGYMPRFVTEEYNTWKEANAALAQQLAPQDGPTDMLRVATNFKSRDVQIGDWWFSKNLTAQDMDIDTLNGLAFPQLGFNVFHDDMKEIIPRYLRNSAEQIGNAAMIKSIGERGGGDFIQSMTKKMKMDEDVVRITADKSKASAAKTMDSMIDLHDGLQSGVDTLKTGLKTQRDNIDAAIQRHLAFAARVGANPQVPIVSNQALNQLRIDMAQTLDLLRRANKRVSIKQMGLKNKPISGPQQLRQFTSKTGQLSKEYDDGVAVINDGIQLLKQLSSKTEWGPAERVLASQIRNEAQFWATATTMASDEFDDRMIQGVKSLIFSGQGTVDAAGRVTDSAGTLINQVPPDWVKATYNLKSGLIELGENFPSLQATPQFYDLWQKIEIMEDPIYLQNLTKYIGGYTKFHKAYATMTPGFHVRNGLANGVKLTFMGTEWKNIHAATPLYFKWLSANKAGTLWDDFVKTLPIDQQEFAIIARKAMMGSGGGIFSKSFKDVSKASKLIDNKLVRFNGKLGQASDNYSRFVLGYDSAAKGMDVGLSQARVKRAFFDYEDLSELDEVMRLIVPFWIWTSRNLVFELQNQWLNPKPYQIFRSGLRNLKDDRYDEEEYPSPFVREMGGIKLPFGNDFYLAPDLGFTRTGQQLEELYNPLRYVNNMNPLLKIPIEEGIGRSTFTGQEYDTPRDRLEHILKGGIPIFNQGDRLFGSEGDSLKNAWLSYIGSPVRTYQTKEK